LDEYESPRREASVLEVQVQNWGAVTKSRLRVSPFASL